MDVVGEGFLAGHLRAGLGHAHPSVTAIASGVSSTSVTDAAAFEREAALVRRVLARSVDRGRRVVFFSTACAATYGADGCPGTEDGPVVPMSPYGRHKLDLEREVRAAPVPTVVLRASHLVGPDQRAHQLLPNLTSQVLAGVVRLVRGAHRDLLDVADLVAILDTILATPSPDVLVNACSGTALPVAAVVDGIEARLGRGAHREVVDGGPLGAARIEASTTRLRELVPTAPVPDDDYLDRLLDRYLPAVARGLGVAPETIRGFGGRFARPQ